MRLQKFYCDSCKCADLKKTQEEKIKPVQLIITETMVLCPRCGFEKLIKSKK